MPVSRAVRWLLAAAAVPVAFVVWWLGSPLLLDRTVHEEFPEVASATIPDTMTRADVAAVMASAAAEARETGEAMPGGAPVALARGSFRDADRFHRGTGRATIYRLPSGERFIRFERFQVTNGPDLRVWISPHPAPASRGDLDSAGYVEMGALKGNVGSQNYAIPADLDVTPYRSVVIYCRPFHVVFSVAVLTPVE